MVWEKGDLSCWKPTVSGVEFSSSFGYYYKLVTLNLYQGVSACPCTATTMMKAMLSIITDCAQATVTNRKEVKARVSK